MSARNARWSFVTTAWLREHGVEHDELVLRGRTDLRPDHEVKTDIGRLLSARYRVALAVDDREDIREVWWSFGIPVALVDDEGAIGAPSPALAAVDAALGDVLAEASAVGPSGLEPLTPSV
ncbi:phosphatase domain-containing protein [Agrococcus jejuensis]